MQNSGLEIVAGLTHPLIRNYKLQINERTYFGLTITPTLSRPMFCVQASLPMATSTYRSINKHTHYNSVHKILPKCNIKRTEAVKL